MSSGDTDGRNLVFIAGCPRSGTTYLQRLLSALPNVKSGQESHLFSFIGPLWKRWQNFERDNASDPRGGVGLSCYLDSEEFKSILHNFLSQLLQPMTSSLAENQIFVEKTPSNALYMETIHQFLPRARIIFIQRDARDTVASLLAASRSWGKDWAPGNAKAAARTWLHHTTRAAQAAHVIPSDIFFEIKYEDLLENPVSRLTEISSFLRLNSTKKDIEESVRENNLEKARKNGGTKLPTGKQSTQKNDSFIMEPDGFVRKGKANSWKSDLSPYEKYCVWRIARKKMKQVGYEWKWPW